MRMKNKEQGQILIVALTFMVVLLFLSGALLGFVGQNVLGTRASFSREQALQLAEAGIEKAIWQLNQGGSYTGESGSALAANTGEFDVAVTDISGGNKELAATGYVPSKANPRAIRVVKVELATGSTTVSFNHAMLVGTGGVYMKNNSKIHGGVYSNGPVQGDNDPRILSGDVVSAGSGGRIFGSLQIDASAYGHTIDSGVAVGGSVFSQEIDAITVGGNVFTNQALNCVVGGNIHYTTISGCTVGGTQNPGYPGEPDPDPVSFPISDEQIQEWKDAASAGGVITGNYELDGSDTASLGPKKITGNLLLSNNSKLTITGPIWVAGDITLQNSAEVILSPAYGNNSEALIADGLIKLKNNSLFTKAGEESYVLVISTSASSEAFEIENNNSSMIAYVPSGTLLAKNNANLFQATANRITLENNAELTYETGLANVNFSATQGGGWQVIRGTWRIVR